MACDNCNHGFLDHDFVRENSKTIRPCTKCDCKQFKRVPSGAKSTAADWEKSKKLRVKYLKQKEKQTLDFYKRQEELTRQAAGAAANKDLSTTAYQIYVCGDYWPKWNYPNKWENDPLTRIIILNKNGNLYENSLEILSDLLYETLEQKIAASSASSFYGDVSKLLDNIEVVVSIPNLNRELHKCAPPLAKALAVMICKKRNRKNCHFHDDVLLRVAKTTKRMKTDQHEAVKNDYDVAEYIKTDENSIIKDQIILLIDDIRTSGATSEFCADLLRQYGAKQVIILCVAQTHH